METELLTSQELAAVLKVRAETVRRWSRDGKIPQVRISRRVRRFIWADVQQALAADQQTEEEQR